MRLLKSHLVTCTMLGALIIPSYGQDDMTKRLLVLERLCSNKYLLRAADHRLAVADVYSHQSLRSGQYLIGSFEIEGSERITEADTGVELTIFIESRLDHSESRVRLAARCPRR